MKKIKERLELKKFQKSKSENEKWKKKKNEEPNDRPQIQKPFILLRISFQIRSGLSKHSKILPRFLKDSSNLLGRFLQSS